MSKSSSNIELNIRCLGDHQTIRFAAEELQRYLSKMTGCDVTIEDGGIGDGVISVGLMSSFSEIRIPDVETAFDDAIDIDVCHGQGYIAGINPRSVLIAVYRYLTELGCRWVRPGLDGEYIPVRSDLPPIMLAETPSYRHRAVCIEGAVSYEHLKDMIDWLPRMGFNAYFIQFREAYTFFNRWYSHECNPLMESYKLTVDEAREYTRRAIEEIENRDLIFHAVGHGWTCEALGIPGIEWESQECNITDDIRPYIAEINGERKLYRGIALNTNCCYSNPAARQLIVNGIVDYAGKHPEADILHFWLADGFNNHCECENCRKERPSDFYVRMLNELDQRLTENGMKTRIAFLLYVDLLWPPTENKIVNPERFILMFAPISRTYSKSYDISSEIPELPPYERNNIALPRGVEENIAYLNAWQQMFSGDSFDFDYHLWLDHCFDPGYMQVSEIISQDVKCLRDLNLHGLISCQAQRVFLPTGLPMVVMGQTLWNIDANFDSIADDYFQSAFGFEGTLCREYLEKLSELFDPPYQRGEKPVISEDNAINFSRIHGVIAEFKSIIERNLVNENNCWEKSWLYLKHHAEIYDLYAGALEAYARGDNEIASGRWEEVKQMINEREEVLHPVFDLRAFTLVAEGKFQ